MAPSLAAQLAEMRDGLDPKLAAQVVKTVTHTDLLEQARKAIHEEAPLLVLQQLEAFVRSAARVARGAQGRQLAEALRDLQIAIAQQKGAQPCGALAT